MTQPLSASVSLSGKCDNPCYFGVANTLSGGQVASTAGTPNGLPSPGTPSPAPPDPVPMPRDPAGAGCQTEGICSPRGISCVGTETALSRWGPEAAARPRGHVAQGHGASGRPAPPDPGPLQGPAPDFLAPRPASSGLFGGSRAPPELQGLQGAPFPPEAARGGRALPARLLPPTSPSRRQRTKPTSQTGPPPLLS